MRSKRNLRENGARRITAIFNCSLFRTRSLFYPTKNKRAVATSTLTHQALARRLNSISTVVRCLLLACFLGACLAVSSASRASERTLEQSIRDAADFIQGQCLPSGQFVYRINTNDRVKIAPKYNILRHAGAMYALAEFARHAPSPTITAALRRANKFLQSQIAPVDDLPETLAVWSDPAVNHSNDPLRAKLGGTGLGLAAMCRLEAIAPGATGREDLHHLGNFLLFMQRDDGGFYSIYFPIFPGRDDRWTSLYYPGEAALGLLLLNDVVRDEEWVRGAKEALLFLSRLRQDMEVVPADHWALIATAKLLEDRSVLTDAEYRMLMAHARQIARFMLSEAEPQVGHAALHGCFSPDGRTTPTATRLEGLLSIIDLLPESDPFRVEIEDACHAGVAFLRRSQITRGKAKGGIPRAVAVLAESSPFASGDFNDRATEVRIDYVQHALSAWLQYQALLAPPHELTK